MSTGASASTRPMREVMAVLLSTPSIAERPGDGQRWTPLGGRPILFGHPRGARCMAETSQISAWIALFLGLYWLAAGVGELRGPNGWWMMLKEFERSPALRFVTGFVTLAFGAAI